MKTFYVNSGARAVLGACLAAGALAACNQNGQPDSAPAPSASLPMEMTAMAAPIAPAPTVSDLPEGPPVQVGQLSDPDDTYAYADEAYSENDAFGDAPPDYGFDYDGTQPWVWYGDDQSERVCEPLPGGGYRYYYYQPGAQYPYLVRDPDYSYGYDSGALVIVYDREGHALPPNQSRERIDAASRILARAQALYAASRQQPHQPVIAANWEARQKRIVADNTAWTQAQSQQSGWAAYHAAHAQQEQAQMSGERYRREAAAARFAQATNQPVVAQRDWQAAQQAHTQAPASPGLFGLHLGGPKPQPAAAPSAPVALGAHAPLTQPAAGPAPAGPPHQGGGFDHRDHQPAPEGAATHVGVNEGARTPPAGFPAARPVSPTGVPSRPEMHTAPLRAETAPSSASIIHPAASPPRAVEHAAPPPRVFERPAPPPVVHAAPVVRTPPLVVAHPQAVHLAPPPKPDDKRQPQ